VIEFVLFGTFFLVNRKICDAQKQKSYTVDSLSSFPGRVDIKFKKENIMIKLFVI